jgi:hypothetical protein
MEWADVVGDEADKDAHSEKSNEKCEGRDEKAAARAVGDGGPYQKADVCEMKEEKKGGYDNDGEKEKNQRAGSDIHSSIETPREGAVEVGKWCRTRARCDELMEGERNHDSAVQERVKLDKASRPAIKREPTQSWGLR